MTKDEALTLALEALEGVLDDSPKVLDASISGGLYEVVQCRDAITAIQEALAQPVQEPVAQVVFDYVPSGKRVALNTAYQDLPVGTKLYTTPPLPVQPVQPVAWGVFEGGNLHDMYFTEEDAQELARLKGTHAEVRPLYTTPPVPVQERNFCERCGKRTADLTTIHTCTPPKENT